MPEEKAPNGKNGKSVGLVERVAAGVKEDLASLKTDMPAKAKEQVEILKKPTKTQLYTSIFRHKHDDTPRNRALGVLSNVFLHLHPAKINRDAVRYSYTWGMGGITFYLFFVLTLTGVLLMFYYHPSKVQAFRDVLYLEHDVPFGKLLRNMHRWAAHLMVIANALLRSYIWHCIGIPIIASIFMILHFWRVRKDGGISGPAPVVLDSEVKEAKK